MAVAAETRVPLLLQLIRDGQNVIGLRHQVLNARAGELRTRNGWPEETIRRAPDVPPNYAGCLAAIPVEA
jgi:hypothetical protein